jgi:hypothetical protein
MTNLFALCKNQNETVTVKRVEISQTVQSLLEGLFQQQENEFLNGVEEEIAFGGDYKPDTDEVLYLNAPAEIAIMNAAADNPISLPTINDSNFSTEAIKGLFVTFGPEERRRHLIQSFAAQQVLSRSKLTLVFERDTFRRLSEPAFALDNKLVAIAAGDKLTFKSFHFLKRIFILEEVYREASDVQIEQFCGHSSLSVSNVDDIKVNSNHVAF